MRLSVIAIFLLFLLAGCTVNTSRADEPEAVAVPLSVPYVLPTPVIAPSPEASAELDAVPPNLPDNLIPNPYRNLGELRDYWRYDLFEVFRGALEVCFDDRLTYSRDYYSYNDSWSGLSREHSYNCEIILPQSSVSDKWAAQINEHYQGVLTVCIAKGDDVWNDNIEDWYVQKLGYYYESAYQTENVITVIRSLDFYGTRPSISWNPFADIFSAADGQELSLDDLFCASSDEYRPVLADSLSNATRRFDRYYDAASDEDFRPMGGIEVESLDGATVAVAPVGLVFIFPTGSVDSMAAGAVFLCVPYEDVQNILNPEFFPALAVTD